MNLSNNGWNSIGTFINAFGVDSKEKTPTTPVQSAEEQPFDMGKKYDNYIDYLQFSDPKSDFDWNAK